MSRDETNARAVVTHRPTEDGKVNWKFEKITVGPIQEDELLVRIVAAGICHTDLMFSLRTDFLGMFPRVLGHEGAGYVEKIGSKVTVAKVGDPVLLSFDSCNSCKACSESHPAYCPEMPILNYFSKPDRFFGENKEGYGGSYFGQSSFASLTPVKQSSVVNVSVLVHNEEELKMYSPLGCGFQTGAGAVTNIAQAKTSDTVVVLGLGGVGLAALMAAKIKGCSKIIGVDRFDSRLEFAKTLGATHVINTSNPDLNLVDVIKDITGGVGSSITIDTTGNMKLLNSGVEFTANRGQFIFIGVPAADAELNVHIISLIQSGKNLRGCIEGDAVPAEYVPQMIKWNREGKFPLENIVKYYPVENWKQALEDMKNGTAIKPVLIF